jgi:hypothetical protein
MNTIKDFFAQMTVVPNEFQNLPEGENNVRMVRYQITDSKKNYDGSDKDKTTPWADVTPQIAITVVSATKGISGGLTHRFNGLGFTKFEELTPLQLEKGRVLSNKKVAKYENHEGYACYKNEQGQLVREVSAKHSESCKNILNQFASSLQIPEGTPLLDGLDAAVENGVEFKITVKEEMYEGKTQYRLTSPRAIKSAVAAFEE